MGAADPVEEGAVPAVAVLEVTDPPFAAGAPLDQAAEAPGPFNLLAGGAGPALVVEVVVLLDVVVLDVVVLDVVVLLEVGDGAAQSPIPVGRQPSPTRSTRSRATPP